jgi:UDP-N-acetylmuramyl pentapeptide phosphotransferase/UDP-N-acetylglucosamine-1-phosphate transferase
VSGNPTIVLWPHAAGFAVFLAADAICFVLLLMLRPFLLRYALARPNARSSHRMPTPQGGGIGVIAALSIVTGSLVVVAPNLLQEPFRLSIIVASVIGLAAVGMTDDVRPLEALPRLLLQAIAAGVVVATLPDDLRVLDLLPWWIERALLLVGILWFVNAVNFMDGIDWMMVVEVVPLTAALAVFGIIGALPPDATLVALALCGAMMGFAPFNRPVARLFLGDVGSLPIGLLVAWLLIELAEQHLIAAALLPLYFVADATITLLLRLIGRQPVMQAHRSHFYQRAHDAGLGVYGIVARVFLVNVALIGLATAALLTVSRPLQLAELAAGCILVGWLLFSFINRVSKNP